MIARDDLGGGIVRRRFTCGAQVLPIGARLSGGELRQMRNLRELVASGTIEVWPSADEDDWHQSELEDRR